MKNFFYPQSICVVGVSDAPGNLGIFILRNLNNFGFKGRWHAVGHIPGKVFGQPIHQSVLDIPEKTDLAVILTRPEHVPETVEACGKKGIKRVAISTAGFSEFHEEGRVPEQKIIAACERYGMRIIGPNCLAVMNLENGLCLPFSPQDPRRWKKGPVGIIAQSGTVAIHYGKHLSYGKVGVGKVASIGNKLDIDEVDLLEYYLQDPLTELVVVYLESFSRPGKFLEIAASSTKPIILHKSNISPLSQEVARSHTNAVTGNDAVTDFALRQAGVIRVRDIHDTMNCVKAALLPPMKGNRLVVMSPGGGTAVMGADEAHLNGFDLPKLPDAFLDWLKSKGRAGVINLTNPLDLGDIYDLEAYSEAIEKLLDFPNIDGVFMDMGYSSEFAKIFAYEDFFDFYNKKFAALEKPLLIRANVAHPHDLQGINEAITAPYFESMPGAFRAMRKVMDARNIIPSEPAVFHRPENHHEIKNILRDAQNTGRSLLDSEGFDILKAMDISVPAYHCLSREKATIKAKDALPINLPVAVKALGDDFAHKTDKGGVMLNIKNQSALVEALGAMTADNRLAASEKFLVQEMAESGTEMLVGAKRDPQFGPVVVVGAGGTMVELVADVCAAPAPLSPDMANRMLSSLKSHALLTGYRGGPPSDVAALVNIMVKISNLMVAFPDIREIDLNPVMVLTEGQGAVVVDCKMFLGPHD
jgi:acyl-CoA synthetase (NDP forming)